MSYRIMPTIVCRRGNRHRPVQSVSHWALLVLLCSVPAAGFSAAQQATVLLSRAAAVAERGDHAEAVRLAGKALQLDPNYSEAVYFRGREHFRLGDIRSAVKDFDRYIDLRPEFASRQWERGIALYYSGDFQAGAAQFELYQTYHDRDVENSVWRFLCMVPTHGLAGARSAMLEVKHDPRVPMSQILGLYRGQLQPADVIQAASEGDATAAQREARLFYAHLYIALYHHAAKDSEAARRYIRLAADVKHLKNRHLNRYMWDVARIHEQRYFPGVATPESVQEGEPATGPKRPCDP